MGLARGVNARERNPSPRARAHARRERRTSSAIASAAASAAGRKTCAFDENGACFSLVSPRATFVSLSKRREARRDFITVECARKRADRTPSDAILYEFLRPPPPRSAIRANPLRYRRLDARAATTIASRSGRHAHRCHRSHAPPRPPPRPIGERIVNARSSVSEWSLTRVATSLYSRRETLVGGRRARARRVERALHGGSRRE